MAGKLVLIFILVIRGVSASRGMRQKDTPVCCTPDQWEAVFILDKISAMHPNLAFSPFTSRHVMMTSYANATIRAAYDWKNQRTFVNISEVAISNESSKALVSSTVIISDYKKGTKYSIEKNTCTKSELKGMIRQCVPGNADYSGVNYFGINSMNTVWGYSYNMTSQQLYVTARVGYMGCTPATVLCHDGIVTSQTLGLMNVEVMNFDPFINSPAIFDVPAICDSAIFQASGDPLIFLYQPL